MSLLSKNQTNGLPKRHRLFVIVLVLLLIAMVAVVVFSLHFKVVDSIPGNDEVIPLQGGILITFNNDILNADDIKESASVSGVDRLYIVVSDKSIALRPLSDFAPGNYLLTIPEIKGARGTIDNFSLSFKAQDLPGVALTQRQQDSLDVAALDGDEIPGLLFPFLEDILVNTSDFDIDYSFADKILTIEIFLRPANAPPLYQQDKFVAAYVAAKDKALAFIESKGVNPKSLRIKYDPSFIDSKYGTSDKP